MKKITLITILVCSIAFLSQSCVKSCTCINPDTDRVTDLEIDPSESCSDYSNATLGNCS
jgi:hypothetical protein